MAVCNGSAKRPESQSAAQQSISISSGKSENFDFGNTLKFPLVGEYQQKKLTTGVYEIRAFVKAGNKKPVSRDDFTREFQVDDENKKVRFKRVSISAPKNIDGQQLSELKAIVSIDQNPIPIALLIWGAVGATGLTAGGYFVNSVNRFTESSFNQILTILGIGLTAYFALK